MNYRDKLDLSGARKMLACDGRGLRGIIRIEVLEQIESELRKSSGNAKVDSLDHVREMQEVAQTLALQKVKAEHFAAFPAAS
jgi:hypothetical protein